MKNSIDARVEFSFKGEDYELVSHIDLDTRVLQQDHAPSFHQILAHDHRIDTISYLYEVMLETDIEFSNPQGLAADFLHEGYFDMEQFTLYLQAHQIGVLLQPIAKSELNIDDLEQHPDIKNALVKAYRLGKGK